MHKKLNWLIETSSRLGFHSDALNFDSIVQSAMDVAGCDDFGEDDWSQPLHLLLEDYTSSASLTPVGRLVARKLVIGILRNRLLTVGRLKDITDLPKIEKPVFILGLPRTGSTLLHELIDLHREFRSPAFWETDNLPTGDWTDSGLIAQSFIKTQLVEFLSPGFRKIHQLGALLPQECVTIQALSFRSMQFNAIHKVDGYHNWLRDCDWSYAYIWHERYLRLLSSQRKTSRWLLKAPGHMLGINALINHYPDAKFIQLHRHPREVVPSMASLYASLRSGSSDRVNLAELGESVLQEWRVGVNRVLTARASSLLLKKRFLDINYRQVVSDPIQTARQIFEFLDTPLDIEQERQLRRYLSKNRKGKHGLHKYSLDYFGLSEAKIASAFSAYIDRFNLAD